MSVLPLRRNDTLPGPALERWKYTNLAPFVRGFAQAPVEAKMTVAGTVLGAYKYDGLSRRIRRVASGVTQDFYSSDQWQLLADYDGSAATNLRKLSLWGIRYRMIWWSGPP